jgi:2-polyprenyl-3-methyl-5-hydroxy-6-metoxy-1,4-benzoquinol methylase
MRTRPRGGPALSDAEPSRGGVPASRDGSDLASAYRGALRWLRPHVQAWLDAAARRDAWLAPSLGQAAASFLACGERDVGERALARLLETQRGDGSWAACATRPTARETADAVRGLLAALPSRPQTASAIRRGCEWLLGSVRPVLASAEDPGVGLSCAAALSAAASALDDGRLREAAAGVGIGDDQALLATLREIWTAARAGAPEHLEPIGFLLDLGRPSAVTSLLHDAENDEAGTPWCTTCLAQLAACWYRVGNRAPGDRALARLIRAQDASGALPGSLEAGASGRQQPSPGATRELLEVVHRHVAGAFAMQVDGFEDHIRAGDGRFAFLLLEAGPLEGRRVLDAGCGRGAITRALLTACPSASVVAMDLSPEMLAHVPHTVEKRLGSIQSLPFENGAFDVVFCVEALEHALNPEGAVDELCRVVRPGGRVLVVDKNAEGRGALDVERWETWFERREVEGWLRNSCHDVASRLLVHCPELGRGLFIGWRGIRR